MMYASRELPRLLAANPTLNWHRVALDDAAERGALDLCGLPASTALPPLKAYQRLVRILPKGEEQRALPLLERGVHSAIQIAGIPQHRFERLWVELFPGEEALALTVYCAALARRSELLHLRMNDVQRNEPHYRAARFK